MISILKFLSFGAWNTTLVNGEASLLGISFGFFVAFLLIKVIGLWIFDHNDNSITNTFLEELIVFLSRVLHVGLYFFGAMLVSMTVNVNLLATYFIIVSIYFFVIGFIIVITERSKYVYRSNKVYHDFILNNFVKGKIYSDSVKKSIKRINQSVNEYTAKSKF